MQENKNNAIEKVENIANATKQESTVQTPLTDIEKTKIKMDIARKAVIEDAVRERAKATMFRQKNKLKEEKRLS